MSPPEPGSLHPGRDFYPRSITPPPPPPRPAQRLLAIAASNQLYYLRPHYSCARCCRPSQPCCPPHCPGAGAHLAAIHSTHLHPSPPPSSLTVPPCGRHPAPLLAGPRPVGFARVSALPTFRLQPPPRGFLNLITGRGCVCCFQRSRADLCRCNESRMEEKNWLQREKGERASCCGFTIPK